MGVEQSGLRAIHGAEASGVQSPAEEVAGMLRQFMSLIPSWSWVVSRELRVT